MINEYVIINRIVNYFVSSIRLFVIISFFNVNSQIFVGDSAIVTILGNTIIHEGVSKSNSSSFIIKDVLLKNDSLKIVKSKNLDKKFEIKQLAIEKKKKKATYYKQLIKKTQFSSHSIRELARNLHFIFYGHSKIIFSHFDYQWNHAILIGDVNLVTQNFTKAQYLLIDYNISFINHTINHSFSIRPPPFTHLLIA